MKKALIYLSVCLFSVFSIFPINTTYAIVTSSPPLSIDTQISTNTSTQKGSKLKNWLVKKTLSKETKKALLIVLLVLGIVVTLISAYSFLPVILDLIKSPGGDGLRTLAALVSGGFLVLGLLMIFLAFKGLKKLKRQS